MNAKSLLALTLLAAACRESNEEAPPVLQPHRTGWDAECVYGIELDRDAEGNYAVSEIKIGGEGAEDFNNRGDIIVEYATDRDWMDVCGRKFTSTAQDDPSSDFNKLSLWLGDGNATSKSPTGDPNACALHWHNGCAVRVWAPEHHKQELRSGMDLRVTLPADYRGKVTVVTQDLTEDDDYLNRGNVCIWDLPGSAEIDLQSGQALVKHADALAVAPTCPADDLAACDAAEWSAECPCLREGHALGSTKITTDDHPADVAVQTPGTIWTNLSAETVLPKNGDENAQPCPIDARLDDLELELNVPGKLRGSVHAPDGNSAAGYTIRAEPKGCDPVRYLEDPDDFMEGAEGELDAQRGEVTICNDCIQNTSCDDFLERGLRVR